MTPKTHAQELLSNLAEDCTFEDIRYQLDVREKIARGLEDIEQGRTVTHEEAKKQVFQWLASSGQTKA